VKWVQLTRAELSRLKDGDIVLLRKTFIDNSTEYVKKIFHDFQDYGDGDGLVRTLVRVYLTEGSYGLDLISLPDVGRWEFERENIHEDIGYDS
jgi:hypothetical protein